MPLSVYPVSPPREGPRILCFSMCGSTGQVPMGEFKYLTPGRTLQVHTSRSPAVLGQVPVEGVKVIGI